MSIFIGILIFCIWPIKPVEGAQSDTSVPNNATWMLVIGAVILINILVAMMAKSFGRRGKRHDPIQPQGRGQEQRTESTGLASTRSDSKNKRGMCIFCRVEDHRSQRCTLNVRTKVSILEKTGRCFRCLNVGHRAFVCTAELCRVCQKNHHTFICRNEWRSTQAKDQSRPILSLPTDSGGPTKVDDLENQTSCSKDLHAQVDETQDMQMCQKLYNNLLAKGTPFEAFCVVYEDWRSLVDRAHKAEAQVKRLTKTLERTKRMVDRIEGAAPSEETRCEVEIKAKTKIELSHERPSSCEEAKIRETNTSAEAVGSAEGNKMPTQKPYRSKSNPELDKANLYWSKESTGSKHTIKIRPSSWSSLSVLMLLLHGVSATQTFMWNLPNPIEQLLGIIPLIIFLTTIMKVRKSYSVINPILKRKVI